MGLLIDIAFFLLAAGGGAAAAALVAWLRTAPQPGASNQAEARFARETLSRLQELTQRVAARVDHHTECVEEVQAQLMGSSENDEASVVAAVAQLIDANEQMQQELHSADEKLKLQARQVESHAMEARTDALTLVANRRALDDEIARCLSEFDDRSLSTTLMLVDVDHFKRFNDVHGHQAGDHVLRTVARVLSQMVSEVGLVARFGGEEFAVVFAGLDSTAAIPYCERARQAIAATELNVGERCVRVTASAGVSELMTGDEAGEALRRADQALYASKNAGRNCGHFNDGRSSRLLRQQQIWPGSVPSRAGSNQVGDEWIYEGEADTEALFAEGIPNVTSRPEFFDELIRRIIQWRRGKTPLTLVLVQVDSYGRILSDHGSSAADVLLRVTAQLINASMRDIDRLARLSDDTFAMLLPGSLIESGQRIAERVRQSVERCRLPPKAGMNWFTVSAGVVQASDDDDLRRILQRGRSALATAVNGGRNRVVSRDALGPNVGQKQQPAAV